MIYEYREPWWNDTDREKPKNLEETCPSATLFTTNPTCFNTGANVGFLTERLANNHPSCETPIMLLSRRGSSVSRVTVDWTMGFDPWQGQRNWF
jgi:hypothetical protein